eukprot:CAMPEP_0176466680 /NCGR_PEP_ID=MMETSP0127-20121128/38037_1 /TAXON_ID=938130 /ORGANISM="Platyophrya macrostoma, Strain WH" /LENGTH=629 /DNA_ID=CAMNT_0017859895 /DNA_START=57 /DNA_END=1946 /DNA_ORIENTATION=-
MDNRAKSVGEKSGSLFKKANSPRNEMRTIIIEYNESLKTEITFQKSAQDQLDCGWLFNQAIKQLSEEAIAKDLKIDLSNIVALKTKSNSFTLDHWLTFHEKSIAPITDGTVLQPYFRDTNQKTRMSDSEASSVTLQDFDLLTKLGKGGYSRVFLARKKQSGRLYALKIISKKNGDANDRVRRAVLRERKNFLTLESEQYMLHLRYCFQTDKSYCFVMDFMPGGDLYHHICRRKFSEEEVKFYALEILLRLECLHSMNYIFRDLKPENLLLDLDGHINFADFGFLKKVSRKTSLNYSYRGTPVYMAPEVINKTGYNYLADYYSYGCVIYEMINGKPPFVASTKQELFDKVLGQDPHFPSNWSPEIQDFLSGLLEKNPQDRLGVKNGFSDLIKHPWLRNLNVAQFRASSLKPPISIDPNLMYFSPRRVDSDVLQDQGLAKRIANSDIDLIKRKPSIVSKVILENLSKSKEQAKDPVKDSGLLKTDTLEKIPSRTSDDKPHMVSQPSTSLFDRKATRVTYLQVPSQADSNLASKGRLTLSSKSRFTSPDSSIMSASAGSERSSRFDSAGSNSSRPSASEQDYEYDTGINEIRAFDKAICTKIGNYQQKSKVRLCEINSRSPFYETRVNKFFR